MLVTAELALQFQFPIKMHTVAPTKSMSSFVLFFYFSVWCMRVCTCSSPCRHTQTPKDVFLGHSLPYLFRVRVSLASLVDVHCFGYTSWPAGPWNFVPVPPSVKELQMCAAWHFFVLFFNVCIWDLNSSPHVWAARSTH